MGEMDLNTINSHIMKKKILYIDMDGVIADFDKRILDYCPYINDIEKYPNPLIRDHTIDTICNDNETFFHDLPPIDGAIEAVTKLFPLFDVYFLSSPMWNVPHSFIGKRIWIEKHFGEMARRRLILTHRKDLNQGHFLVDDRIKNGVENFKGLHIHFGTEKFSNWEKTYNYLIEKRDILL
jgi:5'-nucleotidase